MFIRDRVRRGKGEEKGYKRAEDIPCVTYNMSESCPSTEQDHTSLANECAVDLVGWQCMYVNPFP